MLPVWLSDLRGAFLAFSVLCVADACGLRQRALLWAAALVNAAGFTFSIAFYAHTTRTVFNRRVRWNLRTYWQHLMLTRPLEALWRFLTAPLRVRPDFHILGEVRTGTTSMAAHLRDIGCIGPFSPWIIPLAADKESFYFAGHYFGFVHPSFYRMCFPLRITMWFRRCILGQPSPVFDACASHLNTPWTAALTRCATPDAALVVQLRPPHEQHASWWKLEMGAHLWAKSMDMSQDFLPPDYPPTGFREAQALSRDARTEELYQEGERAGAKILAAPGPLARLAVSWLPERLLPFPGGQLAAFARMGRYVDNLRRFSDLFGLDRLVVIETAELARPGGVGLAVRRLAELVPDVGVLQDSNEKQVAARAVGGVAEAKAALLQRLNASPELPEELLPKEEDLAEIREYYRQDNERLFQLLGRDLGWNSALAQQKR